MLKCIVLVFLVMENAIWILCFQMAAFGIFIFSLVLFKVFQMWRLI